MLQQKTIFSQYQELTNQEKAKFISSIIDCVNRTNPFTKEELVHHCPHCKGKKISKNGFYKTTQKYRCNKCKKEFRRSTNSCIYYCKRPERLSKYMKHVLKGSTISTISREMGISRQLAFDWRHKMLTFLSTIHHSKFILDATATSTEFPYCAKGESKRRPHLKQKTEPHPISAIEITSPEGYISLNVCAEKHFPVEKTAKLLSTKLSITKKVYVEKSKVTKPLLKGSNHLITPITTVKVSHLDEAKIWMKKFRGVASKYLQHYLNGYSFLNCKISPKELFYHQTIRNIDYHKHYIEYKIHKNSHAFTGTEQTMPMLH